ncbi:MAG: hypothetical protein ABW022_27270, partial [Actinoplanes sp.]
KTQPAGTRTAHGLQHCPGLSRSGLDLGTRSAEKQRQRPGEPEQLAATAVAFSDPSGPAFS